VTRSSDTAYARAGLGAHFAAPTRPALVVVDLIRAFTDPSHLLGSDLGGVIAAARGLVDHARSCRRSVFFTTIAYAPGLADAGRWPEKVPALRDLVAGSSWVEIDQRIERRSDEPLIVKKGASALFGTNLASLLTMAAADAVVLCGATTSGCVRATAVDLVQSGFAVMIARECVGDRSSAAHEASLIDLDAKYADVVDLAGARTALEDGVPGP
jgi:maleamate amidohydrolase